jgi:hypothetical protein
LTQHQAQPVETPVLAFTPILSDQEVADILIMNVEWVRAHFSEIPGHERFGMYYRIHPEPFEQWLGGLDRLLDAAQAAELMKVPLSWVYANADNIPGVLRLGRYVRFRPIVFSRFLGGSKACQ